MLKYFNGVARIASSHLCPRFSMIIFFFISIPLSQSFDLPSASIFLFLSSHSQYSPLNLVLSHSSYNLLFSSSLPALHILPHTSNCSLNPGFGSHTGRPSHNHSNASSTPTPNFHIKYATTSVALLDLPIAQCTNTPPVSPSLSPPVGTEPSADSIYRTPASKCCSDQLGLIEGVEAADVEAAGAWDKVDPAHCCVGAAAVEEVGHANFM
ncbi:predicted protein [Plenodomus lingam JN3]|uniref:Predicted protein n=1 Tax=Leptosphaeria maculans (strain JN3 / isolate v23.1.3 / race Av1-4-5-6-7-8) TaxID=985895 RepID=E4ZJU3_LEPMJ|nr:predicted protein [Plenodomus lingam JN3]CBX91378.1 predicted protein [Plenodomus lingam JN3]